MTNATTKKKEVNTDTKTSAVNSSEHLFFCSCPTAYHKCTTFQSTSLTKETSYPYFWNGNYNSKRKKGFLIYRNFVLKNLDKITAN